MLKPESAATRAAELGQEALALTDHGTMSGLITHYKACRKAGVIPIMGIEAYVVPDAKEHPVLAKQLADEKNAKARKQKIRKQVTTVSAEAARLRRHCLLLARDFDGYKNLVKAATKSYGQMYFKPLLDHQDLLDLGREGHLWHTTGCASGEIPRLIQQGKLPAAYQRAYFYADAFRDRYAVELMRHEISEFDEAEVNEVLVKLARDLGLPVIITQDVHYLNQADRRDHDFFKRMVYRSEDGEGGYQGYFHLCDEDFLRDQFPEDQWAEARRGIQRVVEDCRDLKFPPIDSYSYAVPEVTTKNPMAVLINLTRPKLDDKGPEYLERWQAEMRVIRDTGFAQYFLLVRMIVKFCEDNDIFCLARGSASGSLVCYLLGITQVDPIEYGLLFERFLSNDRTKPPDIDLDVEDDRRDEVLVYISQRFKTTQVGTLGTFADRSAKNEVLAQLKRDGDIHEGAQIEEIGADGQRVLGLVTGLKRIAGGHPAGVIAETPDRPISDLIPLMLIASSGRWVTQYDMDTIEDMGLVKVDVLGLRSLRTVRRCLQLLGMGTKEFSHLPLNDATTFKLLSSGRTDGLFTFKGYSAKSGCKQLKPKSIEDCSLVAAIWRPSCLELHLEQLYLDRRKAGWKPPPDLHPVLAQELAETYGIAVYQEQVINVMKGLGFASDDVMLMLRAVKKKDEKLMSQVRSRLHEVAPEVEEPVWTLMEGYTRYGFNRAHSIAYGLFGYRMGYLKANHPLEFMASILETETEKTQQVQYVREARHLGLKVLPADVLRSGITWSIEGSSLRKGISGISGVGEAAARALVDGRPYRTLQELRSQVEKVRCNKERLKKLAHAGAMRSLGFDDEDELEEALLELEKKPTRKKVQDAASG